MVLLIGRDNPPQEGVRLALVRQEQEELRQTAQEEPRQTALEEMARQTAQAVAATLRLEEADSHLATPMAVAEMMIPNGTMTMMTAMALTHRRSIATT